MYLFMYSLSKRGREHEVASHIGGMILKCFVGDCSLMPGEQIFSYIIARGLFFDEMIISFFLLNQHTKLDFFFMQWYVRTKQFPIKNRNIHFNHKHKSQQILHLKKKIKKYNQQFNNQHLPGACNHLPAFQFDFKISWNNVIRFFLPFNEISSYNNDSHLGSHT